MHHKRSFPKTIMAAEEVIVLGNDDDGSSTEDIDWYFASKNAQIEGPYEGSEMKTLYLNGSIDDETHVWNTEEHAGHAEWMPISQVAHIYGDLFKKPNQAQPVPVIPEVDVSGLGENNLTLPEEPSPSLSEGPSVADVDLDDDPFRDFNKTLADQASPHQQPEKKENASEAVPRGNLSPRGSDLNEPDLSFPRGSDLNEPDGGFMAAADRDIARMKHENSGQLPPDVKSPASGMNNLMYRLSRMETENNTQKAAAQGLGVMAQRIGKDSFIDTDEESETESEDEGGINRQYLDPAYLMQQHDKMNVRRFTLQDAWLEGGDEGLQIASPVETEDTGPFYVLVVGSSSKLTRVNIPSNIGISELRKIVGKLEKVKPDRIQLRFKDMALRNGKKLDDYEVPRGGSVIVSLQKFAPSQSRTHVSENSISSYSNVPTIPTVPKSAREPQSINPSPSSNPSAVVDDLPPPLTEEELALEAYPKDKRALIQELTKEVGYPQSSVVVALEITNFSKRYAMEWLLSEEFQLHQKHDTQRGVLGKPKPEGRRAPPLDERKEQPKASAQLTWNCPQCTFANLEVMPYCEMCGMKKNSKAPPKLPESVRKSARNDLPRGDSDRLYDEPSVSQSRASGHLAQAVERESAQIAAALMDRAGRQPSPEALAPLANRKSQPEKVPRRVSHLAVAGTGLRQNPQNAMLEALAGRGAKASQNALGSERGNLKVTLTAAVGLKHKASYCLLTLGKLQLKTRILKRGKSLEFNEVFFFNGFKPEKNRQLRLTLMVEKPLIADKVVGQVSYALPSLFNTLSHDCLELTNHKNETAGLLIISSTILQNALVPEETETD